MAIFNLGRFGRTTDKDTAIGITFATIMQRKCDNDVNLAIAHEESPYYLEAEKEAMKEARERVEAAERMWAATERVVVNMFGGKITEVSA